MMDIFKRKLSSRKFLAAITGVLMGIAMVFGLDENVINTVSGAILAVGSIVSYIVAEGRIDAARVKDAVEKVQDVVELVEDLNE